MKLIVLVDGDPANPKRMIKVAKTNKPIMLAVTGKCDEIAEFNRIYEAIEKFSQSDGDIMIIGTSGREDVIDNLSSERPEMIIPLSSKKTSKYYVEKPVNMFLDLIEIFENVAEPV
jgi:hypothetical protein